MRYLIQKHVNGCAPTAIANILRHYGKKIGQKNIAEINRHCDFDFKDGTGIGGISQGLTRYKIKFSRRARLTYRMVENALKIGKILLIISYIVETKENHAYLVVGKDGDRFMVVNLFEKSPFDIISAKTFKEVLGAKDGSCGWIISGVR